MFILRQHYLVNSSAVNNNDLTVVIEIKILYLYFLLIPNKLKTSKYQNILIICSKIKSTFMKKHNKYFKRILLKFEIYYKNINITYKNILNIF